MIVVRGLRPDEEDAWLDHVAEVFRSGATREYFASHLHNDARALESWDNILVAIDEATGVIAASVRVVPRHQYWNGAAVNMNGIAEVSTKEAYRRRGLAAQLMEAAIAGPMATSHVSCLHTNFERLGHIYARHGYISMPHTKMLVRPISGVPASVRLVPLDLERDWDACLRIYTAFSSRFSGPVVRDREYILHWIRARHAQKSIRSVGAWRDSELLGYVFAWSEPSEKAVEEICVNPLLATAEQEAIANALLAHATSQSALVSAPVIAALHLTVADSSAEAICDYGWMARPHPALGLAPFPADPRNTVFWATDDF
ncbi:hypothetical protein SPRG_06371 [Saprolegnia parasitica CBS 223.65]|uniref:N-acetyltransferase domain-containing protein n=1 Tax=Saprolegnia parasitica (strain CBS 223.65) TaxID=695850 RepID=A0A067CP70_SAPPC|nr:hypothetical protein SPRG_06371 [Saprolegnia parasitica CBS 223.65]KDO28321.1 hypothetical protein SPRG_06371 [Saprolegnia parasitica CBS 223.65]|eukprot:XP_012201140.1 hypothetical protein SPRG_06371 [Saprolegnia parasitica CBS 223.65]